MQNMQKWYNRDMGLLLLRVTVGVVFVYHGWAKLNGIEGTGQFFNSLGIPLSGLMAWVVALVEFLGGLSLIFGIYSRVAAKLLFVDMLVALLLAHVGGPWLKAELPLVLLGATAAIAMGGAGSWVVMKKDCECSGCVTK